MSGVQGEGVGPMFGIWWMGVGPMFQCIIGNGHMGPLPVDRITDGQKHVKTLPSSNFVCGQ